MNNKLPVIRSDDLTKVYRSRQGDTLALDSLNLEVRPGEIFGYLGPNGAGKTTTIRMLLDLIRPTRGTAEILGLDARAESVAIRRRIGFLPGELSLWKARTGRQVVQYIASVRGMPSTAYADELAERLALDLSRRVRDYSSGNRRKLGLVIALMHEPELLILDEPTNGLDPLVQQTFNQLMREARDAGRTVFLSSHLLGEVQAICDRVGILKDGRLKAVETVERLTHVDFRWVRLQFREAVPAATMARLERLPGASDVDVAHHTVSLRLTGDFMPLLDAVDGLYIEDIRVEEPTLEEVFLTYYGNNGATPSRAGTRKVMEVL
ncbi:MAG: ABC transporter ATP-binding protein [Anaerolineae bacterium]|nr:ABC transporter ATP-binding protein [Anaerolineae bacterium]